MRWATSEPHLVPDSILEQMQSLEVGTPHILPGSSAELDLRMDFVGPLATGELLGVISMDSGLYDSSHTPTDFARGFVTFVSGALHRPDTRLLDIVENLAQAAHAAALDVT